MRTAWLVALLLCLATPLSLFFAWTVAPSHLGVGVGGFGYFFHWLTKYPTIGSINGKVAIGMACVLLSSTLPFVLGVYGVLRRGTHAPLLAAGLVGQLLAYLPVLVQLDWALLYFATVRPMVGVGAILRLLGTVSMIGLSVKLLRTRTPSTPRGSSATPATG